MKINSHTQFLKYFKQIFIYAIGISMQRYIFINNDFETPCIILQYIRLAYRQKIECIELQFNLGWSSSCIFSHGRKWENISFFFCYCLFHSLTKYSTFKVTAALPYSEKNIILWRCGVGNFLFESRLFVLKFSSNGNPDSLKYKNEQTFLYFSLITSFHRFFLSLRNCI